MTAFVTRIPIRFSDEDHAQVVYYPRYFHFFHCAFEDLINASGTSYRDVLTRERLGWPAVHSEADFRGPLRMGDTLEIAVAVTRVGDTSVTFAYAGTEAASGRTVVTGSTTVACVDVDSFEKRRVPDKYRELFARYAGPSSG